MESIPKHSLLTLPEDAVENIRKIHNLNNAGRLEEAINILEEWIQKQDHIVKKDFSRLYLEKTLIACKGSVEKAKKQIDRLCTMRTLIPNFFTKTNVKTELNGVLDFAKLALLPKVTNDYYRLILVKFHNNNINSERLMQYYQCSLILTEYTKINDYVNGFILVYDLRKINILDMVTKMNLRELQQFTSISIEGYGTRLKSIHLITDSKAIDLLITTLKQFLSEKIGNRIHVHPTLEELHMALPKDIFPEEYGGQERSFDKLFDECLEEISSEKHAEYMKMMNKAATDESLRQAGKLNEEYLGMPGSFRNLSVD